MSTSNSILVAHGVNLDLLGTREPEIYGSMTLDDINKKLKTFFDDESKKLGLNRLGIHFFQSNSESEYLEELSKGWAGAILNPGAWTHTSLALADRVAGLSLKFVEVHLSNTVRREPIRHRSFIAPHALGTVVGFGYKGYELGVSGLLTALNNNP